MRLWSDVTGTVYDDHHHHHLCVFVWFDLDTRLSNFKTTIIGLQLKQLNGINQSTVKRNR